MNSLAPSAQEIITALVAPFKRNPRDNGWPAEMREERARLHAALSKIIMLAEDAKVRLNWFHLDLNSDERAAIPPLLALRERVTTLLQL